MKQFGKIFAFELKHYLKNKIFIAVTVLLILVPSLVMFFPRFNELISSDTDTDTAVREIMLVKSHDEQLSDTVLTLFSSAFTAYDVQLTADPDDDIKEKILSSQVSCAFVLTSDTAYTYYVNNLTMYDANSSIASDLLCKLHQMDLMMSSGMTPEQAEATISVQIDGKTEKLGVDQMQNYFYTYIMIMALYMVIMLYGQMIATNVATEKSSRAMELLITSADPTAMMFGKVLSSCLAGLIQIVAMFGSSILSYKLNESYWSDNDIVVSIFDMPIELFVYLLIFFLLGFLIYAFLYGAVGSTASKTEDINTSCMPITLLFIAGFFVVMFSVIGGQTDGILMKVCSYIPFTSPIAMFARIAMSNVPWYEITVSVSILVFSVALIGIICAKVYKIGVILYGTTPKLSTVLKAAFKS